MAVAASVIVGVVILVSALLGYILGLTRSYLTIAGTLASAVLIDLWGKALVEWAGRTFNPAGTNIAAWLIISTTFIFVALIVGYGGAVLLPRTQTDDQTRKAKPPGMLGSLLAGPLGALNGTLLASYPLHYATVYIPNADITTTLTDSPLTSLLATWLPWFVLSMVAATCLLVVIRSLGRLLRPRPAPAAHLPANTSVAAAGSPNQKLQAVGNKIDQKLKETE